jgi:hypothetical protein
MGNTTRKDFHLGKVPRVARLKQEMGGKAPQFPQPQYDIHHCNVIVNLEEPISSGYPAQPGLIGESVRPSVPYGCVHVALILWLMQQLHKCNSDVTSITSIILLCDIQELVFVICT